MTKRVFAVVLALFFCGTAGADLYVNISTTSGGGWPYSPYIITPNAEPDVPVWMPAQFDTFCVEMNQTFSPGKYRATIDNDILYGGDGLADLLSDDVKKIYAAYLNGALSGIDGNVVQRSVWGAQGYTWYSDPAINAAITDTGAIAGWNDVKVLNLWGGDAYTGVDRQSQLVMTPVPGAVLLGMIGLGLAGVKFRRFA